MSRDLTALFLKQVQRHIQWQDIFSLLNSKSSNGKTTLETGMRKLGEAEPASTDAISCQAGVAGGKVSSFGENSHTNWFF